MVIGFMLSGILCGLVGVGCGAAAGLGLWSALALYPCAGSVGALSFAGLAARRASLA